MPATRQAGTGCRAPSHREAEARSRTGGPSAPARSFGRWRVPRRLRRVTRQAAAFVTHGRDRQCGQGPFPTGAGGAVIAASGAPTAPFCMTAFPTDRFMRLIGPPSCCTNDRFPQNRSGNSGTMTIFPWPERRCRTARRRYPDHSLASPIPVLAGRESPALGRGGKSRRPSSAVTGAQEQVVMVSRPRRAEAPSRERRAPPHVPAVQANRHRREAGQDRSSLPPTTPRTRTAAGPACDLLHRQPGKAPCHVLLCHHAGHFTGQGQGPRPEDLPLAGHEDEAACSGKIRSLAKP